MNEQCQVIGKAYSFHTDTLKVGKKYSRAKISYKTLSDIPWTLVYLAKQGMYIEIKFCYNTKKEHKFVPFSKRNFENVTITHI